MKSQSSVWVTPVLDPGYARVIAIEIMRLHILGLVDGGEASRFPRVHQVERDLGLAIDHDRLAGRGLHVDAMPTAGEGKLDAFMQQPFGMRPRAGADLVEQSNRSLLQKAGPDASEHVIRALSLENNVVDAVLTQKLPEQQSCRPGPDDCDFCPQYLLLPIL
ncbi:hypothetical protein ACVWZ4_003192 [Bradyrhizobium sp. USDA 4472]